jgi:DNA repair exonuclease SbcCD ATPase subunit
MKIVKFQAENFLKLVCVEISPNGNVVEITGRNGQGKTSVLNAIWAALGGKEACPSVPIRKGQESARVRLDLGELVVTRTFTLKDGGDYTTHIAVENADGARYPSAQTMIDALLGELAFDPLAFARMEPRAQFDALKRFVPEVDFDAIANAERGDRERRTEVNRFAKQERAAAQVITVPVETPAEPIDESALVQELTKAGEHNADVERRRANRTRLMQDAQQLRKLTEDQQATAKELRERADELEQRASANIAKAAEIDKKLADAGELPAPIDTAAVTSRINKARLINANVRKLDERMKHHGRALELEKQAEEITARIEKRQSDKLAAIAAAKVPVQGIGFGDGHVILNGLPFEQASDAEQLQASVLIAMALNPKLRVIRIRDGSLLDPDAMKLLAEMAEKNDMQVWIERVDASGKVGFVLEDGHVRRTSPSAESSEAAA